MNVKLNSASTPKVAVQPEQTPQAQSPKTVQPTGINEQDSYEGPSAKSEPQAPVVDKYAATTDASSFTKRIMEFLIRLVWKSGSSDVFNNPKRLTTDSVKPVLDQLQPGDIILNGSGGGLTHAAVYAGNGDIIHSMATNTTGRGFLGAAWDTIKRAFGHKPENVGVIREKLGDFFDRYPRDTMVVMRNEDLSEEQRTKGMEKIETLVGAGYDYDFSAGDNTYYCTEIGIEFLKAAQGEAPIFNTTPQSVPLIWSGDVVEPPNMFENQSLKPILASETAREQWEGKRAISSWF